MSVKQGCFIIIAAAVAHAVGCRLHSGINPESTFVLHWCATHRQIPFAFLIGTSQSFCVALVLVDLAHSWDFNWSLFGVAIAVGVSASMVTLSPLTAPSSLGNSTLLCGIAGTSSKLDSSIIWLGSLSRSFSTNSREASLLLAST